MDTLFMSDKTFLYQRQIMELNHEANIFCELQKKNISSGLGFICFALVPTLKCLDPSLQGSFINMSVGRDSIGAFSVSGVSVSADGCIILSNPKDVVKCSPGDAPWMLIRFAHDPEGEHLEGFDAEFFQMLGFGLTKGVCQSVAIDGNKHSCIAVAKEAVFFQIKCTKPG